MNIQFSKLGIVFISVFLLITGCAEKKEPQNIYQAAIFDDARMDDDVDQDEARYPEAVLALTAVQPGMSVIDISAGSGYYSELFSRVVGDNGKVYLHNSVEKNTKIAGDISKRIDGRLKNTQSIASNIEGLEIPDMVDIAFVSKIFHDFYVPADQQVQKQKVDGFFNALKSKVKQGGKVLIIDHSAPLDSGISTTSKNHRIDENFVKNVFKENGFSFVSESGVLRNTKDPRTANIWDGSIFKKTDQFIFLFQKD